jgi:hypothetical protein
MKTILLIAACAATLTGCAGNETAVRASAPRDFATGPRSYALASDAATAADAETKRYASAIARRLTELGFAAAPADVAHYRLALSHETRPASVGVRYPRCADGAACGAAVLPPGLQWPGQKAYFHSLTLRFFDRTDGREAYKVSVTKRDRAPDARDDIDDLVTSALARVPFAQAGTGTGDRDSKTDWKVTLGKPEADGGVPVTRVAPLTQ